LPDPVVVVTMTVAPPTVALGDTVTLRALASSNITAGEVTTYQWDFDANGTSDQTTAVPMTTTTYATVGAKTPRVYASTANGTTGSGAATVTVTAPALAVTVSVAPSTPQPAGTSLTFTAVTTASGGSAVPSGLTYEWDWTNDGVVDFHGGASNVATTSYTGAAGNRTLRVTVRAPDGRTATNTITLSVS
jgi:hypothetical protein